MRGEDREGRSGERRGKGRGGEGREERRGGEPQRAGARVCVCVCMEC